MKKQILSILDQSIAREELNEKARFSLSANYSNIVPASNKTEISTLQKEFVKQELNKKDNIDGFEINISLQKGVHEDEFDNIYYDQNWHEVSIYFAGGEEEDEEGINPDIENVFFFNVEFKSNFTSNFNVQSFLRETGDKNDCDAKNMVHHENVGELLNKIFKLYNLASTFVDDSVESINEMKFNK